MRIESFQPVRMRTAGELAPEAPGTRPAAPATSPAAGKMAGETPEFSKVLGQELGRVNELLAQADQQAQKVATGDADNLQEAMVAMAEADLALQVTMRVTQKAIAAYQEISRLQI